MSQKQIIQDKKAIKAKSQLEKEADKIKERNRDYRLKVIRAGFKKKSGGIL